jgi:hypothetical protein
VKAAHDEERRREAEWIEHYNSTRPLGEAHADVEMGTATPLTAYKIAKRVVEADEDGVLKGAHEETPKLARAYLDAIQKHRDAMEIMTSELAVSHPALLDELNKPVDLDQLARDWGIGDVP